MSKHTQGQWVVDAENNLIHASDDRHTVICSFHGSMRNQSVAADARLIAAAPELLEALKSMLCMHEEGATLHGLVGPTVASARAAIEKATGVSQ